MPFGHFHARPFCCMDFCNAGTIGANTGWILINKIPYSENSSTRYVSTSSMLCFQ